MVEIIDGRKIGAEILEKVKREVDDIKKKGVTPCLAIIRVKGDEPSRIYTEIKRKRCREAGIKCVVEEIERDCDESYIVNLIERYNVSQDVHGILVQLPLPNHINRNYVLSKISPLKDVDGLNPITLSKLFVNDELLAPCAAKAVVKILDYCKIDVEGKDVVIINNSNLIGKPLAIMLSNRFATVSVCHVKTRDLRKYTKNAEILISATGVPKLIGRNMVKSGVIAIDVGISKVNGKICGDFDFDGVKEKASYITPVPGGVGPVTVAVLLENLMNAIKLQVNHSALSDGAS